MKRALFVLCPLLACSEAPVARLDGTLTTPAAELTDPFRSAGELSRIRVRARKGGTGAELVLPLTARSFSFEALPAEADYVVEAEVIDLAGEVVGLGRKLGVDLSADASVTLPVVRNLAFASHQVVPGQDRPASRLYALDPRRLSLAAKIELPDPQAVAGRLTARGSAGVVAAYSKGSDGFVGLLSSQDLSWSSMPLLRRQDVAALALDSGLGVAAGGGAVALFDFDQRRVLTEWEAPGEGLAVEISQDGRLAVVALSGATLAVVLEDSCTSTLEFRRCVQSFGLESPSGLVITPDRLAYVSSSTGRLGLIIALDRVDSQPSEHFTAPTRAMTYAHGVNSLVGVGAAAFLPYVEAFRVDAGVNFQSDVQAFSGSDAMAADASGRRVLIVAAGAATATAGVTTLELRPDAEDGVVVTGSRVQYPTDPDEPFTRDGFSAHRRYRPKSIATLVGR